MTNFQISVLFCACIAFSSATSAEVKEYTGIYREYKNFHAFWPCGKNIPHFVELMPKAVEDIETFLGENGVNLFIRVEAELFNEKKRGLDGWVVIHEVIDSGHNVRC